MAEAASMSLGVFKVTATDKDGGCVVVEHIVRDVAALPADESKHWSRG